MKVHSTMPSNPAGWVFLASKQGLNLPVFMKVMLDTANTLHFGYSSICHEQNSNLSVLCGDDWNEVQLH